MDRFKSSSIFWALGGCFSLFGMAMLVVPHQFRVMAALNPSFGSEQGVFAGGLSSLTLGTSLLILGVIPRSNRLMAILGFLSAGLLLWMGWEQLQSRSWISAIHMSVLGLGAFLAGLDQNRQKDGYWQSQGIRREAKWQTVDLFELTIATSSLLTGVVLLLADFDLGQAGLFDLSVPERYFFGGAFALCGLLLGFSQLRAAETHQVGLKRVASLISGLLFIEFLIVSSNPDRVWITLPYFGYLGLFLILLTWFDPALETYPVTLKARLALALALFATIPVILSVAISGRQEESLGRQKSMESQQRDALIIANHLSEDFEQGWLDNDVLYTHTIKYLQTQAILLDAQVYLISKDGKPVVSAGKNGEPQTPIAADLTPQVQDWWGSGQFFGSTTYRNSDGEHALAFARVENQSMGVFVEKNLTNVLSYVYAGQDSIFILLLLFLGASILAGVLLANWLVIPIDGLTRAVGGLAESEKTLPLPRTEFIELQKLTGAFAILRQRLAARTAESEQAMRELRKSNDQLAQAKSELELRVAQRTSELQIANQRLERANEQISQVNEELSALNLNLEHELEIRSYNERQIQEQNTLLNTILTQAADGILAVDLNGEATFVNDAAQELFSQEKQFIQGASNGSRLHTKDEPVLPYQWSLSKALQGETIVGEVVSFQYEGQERFVRVSAAPLKQEDGTMIGAVTLLADISEAKHMEQALRESESQLRTLLEFLPVGVWLVDQNGTIVYVNQAGNRIWQGVEYVRQEEYGRYKAWWYDSGEPLKPEDWAVSRAIKNREASLEEVLEIEAFDGSHKIIKNAAVPIKDDNDNLLGVVVVNEDITERVLAEKATEDAHAQLHRSEARARRLVEANVLAVSYGDPDGVIREANDAFLAMTGYTQEDLEAGSINWYKMTPPEYLDADHQAELEARQTGACKPFEKEYIRKDGSRVPVLIGFALVEDPHLQFLAFTLDLTHQKRAEKAIQEYAERLERSNQDLQDFAFIASHDLQEPLRKIQSFGKLLLESLEGKCSSSELDYISRMRSASSRMKLMIDDLLDYSRISTRGEPFLHVDLNQTIKEVVSDLEIRINETQAQITLGPMPDLQADPAQMRQLFQNLISNAMKFHLPGVPPEIHIEAKPAQLTTDQGLVEALEIMVQDNGIGFDEQFLARMFQPFQRLHGRSEYEGSGIGLPICKRIVERHGGQIWARSKPGEGATFFIRLPVTPKMNSEIG